MNYAGKQHIAMNAKVNLSTLIWPATPAEHVRTSITIHSIHIQWYNILYSVGDATSSIITTKFQNLQFMEPKHILRTLENYSEHTMWIFIYPRF